MNLNTIKLKPYVQFATSEDIERLATKPRVTKSPSDEVAGWPADDAEPLPCFLQRQAD